MTFTFYAFLPKASMIDVTGRSSGLLPVEHLPIPNEQWSEDSTVCTAAYSYGDSAGFTPASHFNSAVAETNYVGKSREEKFPAKNFYWQDRVPF